jgi:hypothetical protein
MANPKFRLFSRHAEVHTRTGDVAERPFWGYGSCVRALQRHLSEQLSRLSRRERRHTDATDFDPATPNSKFGVRIQFFYDPSEEIPIVNCSLSFSQAVELVRPRILAFRSRILQSGPEVRVHQESPS